jgi:hypothetical protein
MTRWLPRLGFGILGIALGLGYGWKIDPVKFVDTTPASLRADFRADFVLMAAEVFAANHDSEAARRQLAMLGGDSPAATAAEAIQTAEEVGYSHEDLSLMQDLARAMRAFSAEAPPPGGAP